AFRHGWRSDPYSGGGYPARLGTGLFKGEIAECDFGTVSLLGMSRKPANPAPSGLGRRNGLFAMLKSGTFRLAQDLRLNAGYPRSLAVQSLSLTIRRLARW